VTPVRGELLEGARRWTAADLCALRERIALRLREEGIGPGARVAVAIGETAPYLMAVLAAREAGALVALLSSGDRTFHLSGNPAVVALVGLQGSGKTTSTAKLARHVVKLGRRPLLVAADPYRPATPRGVYPVRRPDQPSKVRMV